MFLLRCRAYTREEDVAISASWATVFCLALSVLERGWSEYIPGLFRRLWWVYMHHLGHSHTRLSSAHQRYVAVQSEEAKKATCRVIPVPILMPLYNLETTLGPWSK